MPVGFLPVSKRVPDTSYRDLLLSIIDHGRKVRPIQDDYSLMIAGRSMRFQMDHGFPLITERDLSGRFLQAALGEHIAFLNGARTHEELKRFGCPYWSRWVTAEKCVDFGLPEGDLGDGSYGPAWVAFPTAEGYSVNQMENVVALAEKVARGERPYLRTLRVSNWIPQHIVPGERNKRRTVVAPCHGDLHIVVYPDDKEIDIIHNQRSADVPVGLVFNMAQYAAFGMMLSQVISHAAGEEFFFNELVYWLQDAHIYGKQLGAVNELLAREPRHFPTMEINPRVASLFDFRPEDFTISDYDPHPTMVIPTPV